MEQVTKIAEFIVNSFIHIWPYLLITIPLAVFVRLSDISKKLKGVLSKSPVVSIFLATAVGAFSPFCSCGVIPVIASMLIGGVPLAPVMSFWIASPSMDPEIFFLSVASVGWEMSVWRLMATFIISLLAGYVTHILMVKGRIGENILRKDISAAENRLAVPGVKRITDWFKNRSGAKKECCGREVLPASGDYYGNNNLAFCCTPAGESSTVLEMKHVNGSNSTCCTSTSKQAAVSIRKRITDETLKAIVMVAKFMTLAFLLNALIQFYVPQDHVYNLLGGDKPGSVFIATLVGIPFYTSNITALPMVSGLLEKGMNEGAALAFLISGPMTTLPAMAAVSGLVKRKVFALYISFALIGSILFGLLLNIFG